MAPGPYRQLTFSGITMPRNIIGTGVDSEGSILVSTVCEGVNDVSSSAVNIGNTAEVFSGVCVGKLNCRAGMDSVKVVEGKAAGAEVSCE